MSKNKDDDEILSALGQSFHTGLRKAGESAAADRAWHAISDMPGDDWHGVLKWALWAMRVSGYEISRKDDPQTGG